MTITHDYLSLPKRLICDLRDNALAIAIYFFVARLYLVQQKPVPLSRGDIRTFDPAAKMGAIKRALDRLVQAGWLVETAGYKSSYVPVWGTSRSGVPYRWQIGAARLGRPTHIETIRVDRRLLDLFMGRFMPHTRNPSLESYFTRPLLSLADIGVYILISAELPMDATDELLRWGLVKDGQAQLVPDDAVVLALASQRASVGGSELTMAGWRKLGWFGSRATRPAQQGRAEAVPLLFVPKERIGAQIPFLIGHLIGGAAASGGGNAASERGETASIQTTPTMPGISRDFRDSRETPPNPPTPDQGGGAITSEKENDREVTLPDTEAARALFAFGVNDPTCLVDLATMPIEQLGGAIAYAEAEDLGPGWVVTALRRHRDEGWPLPTVRIRERGRCIDSVEVMSGTYGDLFRLGSDLTDLDGSLTDPESGPCGFYPPAHGPTPHCMAQRADTQARGQEQAPGELSAADAQREEIAVCETDGMRLDRLWSRVLDLMRMQIPRQEFATWLGRTALLSIVNGVATVGTPSAVLKTGFEDHYLGAVRHLISDLSIPIRHVRVVITKRPRESSHPLEVEKSDVRSGKAGFTPPACPPSRVDKVSLSRKVIT